MILEDATYEAFGYYPSKLKLKSRKHILASCELCGKKLSVHHVNYNKDCGCDGDKTCQFVPLCKSCHSKTNNNRDYWQKIITDKLHGLIIGWDV